MRVKCHCGNIAGWWYAPTIYKKLSFDEYIASHAYCEEHTDLDNPCEYHYVGFHKKDWQWLHKNKTIARIKQHNQRLSLPYWGVSHVHEGRRWSLGRYGGVYGHFDCASLEEVVKATARYNDVQITEGWYE